ncbi:MAG: response regulator [Oligoflexus sp.]|nr:response regulator [Oligoflexus sp.]
MNSAKKIVNVVKQKILIVEDEPMLLEMLVDLSESFGFDVLPASNGQLAIEILKAQKVDIILSDINMPLVSGLQLLIKCRKMNVTAPFVFLTGNSSIDTIIDAVRLGAIDFMVKPFEFEALEKVLRRVSVIAEKLDYIDELLNSIGKDVAPQTHDEIENLRRQINLLKTMSQGES